MKRWLVLATLAGCVDVGDSGGPWTPLAAIEGELAAEIGPPPAPRDPPTETLRVVTWNVHRGPDIDSLADEIARSTEVARADVLLVQEIEAYPSEGATRASRLAAALAMTWVYVPARSEGDGTHGLAMFSRYPLADVTKRELPFLESSFNERNRIAVGADVVLGERRVRVVDVHLDVRIGAVDRVRQLHPAVNEIPDAVVVGGDFNTNPWAWAAGAIPLVGTEAIVGQEQAAVIDDYLAGKGFASAISVDVATMRLPAFQIRTDDLYARELPIRGAGVEHVGGSDHWPVWVDVGL